ncbi:hypothetical protein BC826DRAFT_988234 [Russula brevipes]|nr:hypothetical protein BC826DRAFT_1017061 [Russula brevipes]KAI0302274.1 hypothetical protein BC826DRAFT_988234 [Russula brevipes]
MPYSASQATKRAYGVGVLFCAAFVLSWILRTGQRAHHWSGVGGHMVKIGIIPRGLRTTTDRANRAYSFANKLVYTVKEESS